MLCIWWDQKGVLYYELLKPGETIYGERYRTQLIYLKRAIAEKRPQYASRPIIGLIHSWPPSRRSSFGMESTN